VEVGVGLALLGLCICGCLAVALKFCETERQSHVLAEFVAHDDGQVRRNTNFLCCNAMVILL
jgi:hypothetical protein